MVFSAHFVKDTWFFMYIFGKKKTCFLFRSLTCVFSCAICWKLVFFAQFSKKLVFLCFFGNIFCQNGCFCRKNVFCVRSCKTHLVCVFLRNFVKTCFFMHFWKFWKKEKTCFFLFFVKNNCLLYTFQNKHVEVFAHFVNKFLHLHFFGFFVKLIKKYLFFAHF